MKYKGILKRAKSCRRAHDSWRVWWKTASTSSRWGELPSAIYPRQDEISSKTFLFNGKKMFSCLSQKDFLLHCNHYLRLILAMFTLSSSSTWHRSGREIFSVLRVGGRPGRQEIIFEKFVNLIYPHSAFRRQNLLLFRGWMEGGMVGRRKFAFSVARNFCENNNFSACVYLIK